MDATDPAPIVRSLDALDRRAGGSLEASVTLDRWHVDGGDVGPPWRVPAPTALPPIGRLAGPGASPSAMRGLYVTSVGGGFWDLTLGRE